jgi:cysteine synthase A
MNVAQNIADLVGNTPMIKLNKIDKDLNGNIYGKCEFMNPTSSVKDRMALNMLIKANEAGLINENTQIIEPTSGNTGIALAALCASMGFNLTLTMPESMSQERRDLINAFGANIVLTPAAKGMTGAINKAIELEQENENALILQQFENPNNPAIHETTTAVEILRDMDDKIDILVVGVGTGGTISGAGKILKEKLPNIKIIAVEPSKSSVLSGNGPAPHRIQGIGAGFVPKILDTEIYDEVIQIDDEDAVEEARELARKEGIFVGISAGANVYASKLVAQKEENKGKNIVTILCDTGERYLSTGIFKD